MSAASRSTQTLTLAAMIFAVAMTFIDQTIVSIAVPDIQRELHLSSTGVQWAVNAYLLSLAALFAFGGRLADTLGQRRMVVLGVAIFAVASALCGATPKGSAAEAWIVAFRVLQGAGGAIMYPAALAIVVATFPLQERGKALATFFGIAGGLTAVGPILGGYLTQWTWRAIFWVNIPIAIIALVLTYLAKPVDEPRKVRMDLRGLGLVVLGVGLSVFGFQQANIWGWRNPAVGVSIGLGLIVLVVFYFVELKVESPLINVRFFHIKPFLVENSVLGISMLVFVPVFFFASEYAQIALGKSASEAGLYLLYFFIGFFVLAQVGGRMLDRGGAKRPVVLGCALAAVGFLLWAHKATDLELSAQIWYVMLAGGGLGMMLGPASADAVNRVPRSAYGEATGINQTVRNYAASLGLAILGTIAVSVYESRLRDSLIARGEPRAQASRTAKEIAQASQGGSGKSTKSIDTFIRVDFAHATQVILYIMGSVMIVAGVIALLLLKAGRQTVSPDEAAGERPGEDPAPALG